jgi:hypothetical protein
LYFKNTIYDEGTNNMTAYKKVTVTANDLIYLLVNNIILCTIIGIEATTENNDDKLTDIAQLLSKTLDIAKSANILHSVVMRVLESNCLSPSQAYVFRVITDYDAEKAEGELL